MKKIFRSLMVVMALAFGAATMQAQFRYGPVAGATISTLHFKQDLASVSNSTGVQAGLIGEMMFPGIGFGIDLGLIYNMTGANVDLGDKLIWSSMGYGKEHIVLHQIQIPFHLRFKWTRMNGLEDFVAPFIYGGPDLNILVGHSRCDAIKYTAGDVGLTAGVGAELWKNWQISGSYTWGMTYALKTQLLTDYSARTRQWTVRLTYLF